MKTRLLACCESIELLKRIPPNSVNLAYIDPPWIAAQTESHHDLLALYLHTAALCKASLTEEGVIVWHAVPHLVSDTRSVLDRVFERDHFETEFVLKRRQGTQQPKFLTPGHSNLIVYSKTGKFHYYPPTRALLEGEQERFNKKDSAGRCYRLDSLLTAMNRPSMSFEWRGQTPPSGRSWRYSQDRLEQLAEELRIEFGSGNVPRLKRYMDESPAPPLDSVWDDLVLPPAERAAAGNRPAQQPIELAERILNAFTKVGDTILDPYCGTGTLIVAAELLNRQWYGADNDPAAIETTLARLHSSSTGLDEPIISTEIEPFDVQHRLSELLKSYKVDHDPHSADTHILAKRDESKVLEFKQTLSLDLRTRKKEAHIGTAVLKTVAAFLNSDGGTLLIGVADNNEVPGIEPELAELFGGNRDKFLLHFKSLLKDNIGAEFYPLIDQRIVLLDDARVMRVDVQPAQKPCFVGDDFYVRTNPATDKLQGPTLIKYVQQRFSDSQQ